MTRVDEGGLSKEVAEERGNGRDCLGVLVGNKLVSN